MILGLFSNNPEVSEEARNLIIEARNNTGGMPGDVRIFITPNKPEINIFAENVLQLLKFDEYKKRSPITAPPLLNNFDDVELQTITIEQLPKVLVHSQANERAVQQTTKAAHHNIGVEKQKMNILCSNKSREQFSTKMNKSNFLN